MGQSHFGNSYQIGQTLITIVKRMQSSILQYMQEFNPDQDIVGKDDAEGTSDADITTVIDTRAQKVCIDIAEKTWGPELGIIAEESGDGCLDFRQSAYTDCEACLTIDPLDGTRAFVNGGSTAVGIILSLTIDGETVGSVVCNIATKEIYLQGNNGYPYQQAFFGSQLRMQCSNELSYEEFCDTHCIAQQNLTSRGYNDCVRFLLQDSRLEKPGLYKRSEVVSGSTALNFARLWKGEVSTMIVPGKRTDTPWDMNAIFAINQQDSMRVRRFEITEQGFREISQDPLLRSKKRPHPHMYIPSTHAKHVRSWAQKNSFDWSEL